MISCYELLYCTDSEKYLITMGPEQLYFSHSVKELQTLSALVSSFFKKMTVLKWRPGLYVLI